MIRFLIPAGVAVVLIGAPIAPNIGHAQAPADADKKEAPKDAPKKKEERKGSVRPYDEVITKEAKSDPGLFIVHRVEDKIFYEIPVSALGKDMLWVTQLEKTPTGRGYGGSPVRDRVVRWEQRDENVLLRDVRYEIRADVKDPITNAVEASSVEPIIEVFPVRAYGKDKNIVVEVTSLFTSDIPEFSAANRLGGGSIDSKRTFIEKVKSFPENIETKVLATYRGGGGGGPRVPGQPNPFAGQAGGSATAVVHHSMVKLPEEKMRPRRFDSRVGFFSESFQDYGDVKNHQVEEVRYVTRWRLEKKDPNADVSEPKKQIVYYLGREIPAKWRPWVKKGIEMWQPAFEGAGYKNAIIAKDAPTPQEDPNWDAEDARYSSIRWLPSTIENAMGPHVHDPRTGEILEADILMYHNVLKLIRDWYFVQASPNDPRAQSLPLPDELVGEVLAYVVAHEVGHTLGFPHNMKASSSYSVEQLRDPKFTAANGTEASIMDYGRFNYVAQPGDGARLIPLIGPYDKFAVEWGYKSFKNADTYEKEKAELDKIVARQVTNPMLRFGDPNPFEDPSQQTEDLGSDPVAATTLGLKNIDRVASYLVKATAKKGEDYTQLRNMYDQLIGQRNRELNHVIALVGGVVENNVWYGDGDRPYEPISSARQKGAVQFLVANTFQTPASLITPDILERLQAHGAADRILGAQQGTLRTLLSESRLKRMAEIAARKPEAAYLPVEMIDDLTAGIFSEIKADKLDIDLYRRNLQRAYVDTLIAAVNQESPSSDLPALARGALQEIAKGMSAAAGKGANPTTERHVSDLAIRIKEALEPKAIVRGASGGGGARATPFFP